MSQETGCSIHSSYSSDNVVGTEFSLAGNFVGTKFLIGHRPLSKTNEFTVNVSRNLVGCSLL